MYKVLYCVTSSGELIDIRSEGPGIRVANVSGWGSQSRAVSRLYGQEDYRTLWFLCGDLLEARIKAALVNLGAAFWVIEAYDKMRGLPKYARISNLREGSALGYSTEQHAVAALIATYMGGNDV